MARQSGEQKETVQRLMHEYKHGDLESGTGKPVKSGRQAVAIALHEAGASNQESPAKNRRNLKHTKRQEAKAGETRAALYAEAQRRGIPGRSRMDAAALRRALGR